MAVAALILATLAALAAAWTAWEQRQTRSDQRKLAARQNGIADRVASIEEQRRAEEIAHAATARVRAEMQESGKGGMRELVIENLGPSHATALDVEPSPELAELMIGDNPLPLASLAPGHSVTLFCVVAWQTPQYVRGTLTWTDGTGEHRELITLAT